MTEKLTLWIQVAKMSFLHRVDGLSLTKRVRSSDIRRELGVEPLLLRIERSQLRASPLGGFRACQTGWRPQGRPRACWRIYVSHLAWEFLVVPLGGAGKHCWEEGHLDYLAQPAVIATGPG